MFGAAATAAGEFSVGLGTGSPNEGAAAILWVRTK